jgi:type II secretory pathway pseudopilin PulG
MDRPAFGAAERFRLPAHARPSEAGQSLIEVVTAMAVFAIVSVALVELLLSSVHTSNMSRARTIAQRAASTQIEQIRNLPYTSVGNISGNPPGSVPLTSTINVAGLTATRTTKISFVNDPTPLSYQSYANYKQVTVTITRSSDGLQLAREVTNVAPPVKASQSQGTIVASVVDIGNNSVVANVPVSLGSGPSGSESDVTDASGTVTFAGLLPTTGTQPNYDVTVTPPGGYVVLKDTQPPQSTVHFPLSPGQLQPATIKIYQPATIYVRLLNFDGTAFTGSASVNVTSVRGTQTFAYTSPQLAVTALNGEALVPGINYTVSISGGFIASSNSGVVPNAYPTDLTSTFSFTNVQMATVVVPVTNAATPAAKCTATTVTITGGPLNITGTTLQAGTDTNGNATFSANVPVGTGYTIKATKGLRSGTSSTTQVVAPTTTAATTVLSGTTAC